MLDIDRDRQRISLGLKQTQEDPWQRVIDEYQPGDVLEGKVTKVVAFGAFVEILPGVEGLVHISELADHHVESPSEVVEPGQEVWVQILEIDETPPPDLAQHQARPALAEPAASRPDPAGAHRARPESAPAELPDLDVSDEVFPETPGEDEPAAVEDEPAAVEEEPAATGATAEPIEPAAEDAEPADAAPESSPEE